MRRFVGVLCVIGVLWPVGSVSAQVGLYGSPEVLQLPAIAPPATPTPALVPATAAYRAPVASYPATAQQPAIAPIEYQPPNPAYGRQWIATTNSVYGQPGAAVMGAGPTPGPGSSASAPAVASVPRIEPAPIAPMPTPAVQPRNLTNQMLGETIPAGPAVAPGNDGCAGESVFGGGLSGCGVGEPCAEGGPACEAAPCCPWYGDVLFLYMCRNQPNRLWTTYESGNEPQQIPTDINLTWAVGGQATVGYRFGGCCPWALEATYWGLNTIEGEVGVTHPHGVSTTLDVSRIEFDSINGMTYFDNAAEHRLWRKDQVHNVEVGLVYGGLPCGEACNPWDFRWGIGARYFRFEEKWSFGTLEGGHTWGEGDGEYEAYLYDHITNNLIGAQLGCDMTYRWRPRISFFLTPKVGVYDNQINHYFTAYRGDDVIANPTAASKMTESYPVVSTKNALACLTEIDIGLDWRFSARWSARMGYRAVIATGMGLADNQIPHYVVDIPAIREIDYNGELILHGGFAGLTYSY